MKKVLALLISFFVLVVSSMFLYGYYFITTAVSDSSEELVFEVKPGAFYQTANKLEAQKLISNSQLFTLYARLRGDVTNIKVGEFLLSKNNSPQEILNKLISSDYVKYQVTIPEGYNIFEVAKIVENQGLVNSKEFLNVARNKDLATKTIGVDVPSFEGFLFPETYSFSKTESAEQMVLAMYAQFKKNYEKVLAENNDLNMSKLKHIVLASMIEKETGAAFERPVISSVFHNRLKKRMRLQSDPTILYGIMMEDGVWLKNIRRKDIRRSTDYNTYTIASLPPAPIANPGIESIRAALNPDDTPYFYFVSQNDGTHVFTKTYKEHTNAVRKYQLNQGARKGKSWRDLKNKHK